MTAPPEVFVSWCHGTPDDSWTREFVARLIADGINVKFDENDLPLGGDVAVFMSQGIVKAARVLVMCNEPYVAKADNPKGGIGYESLIINGQLSQSLLTLQFIPIICPSNREKHRPAFLATKRCADFSDPSREAEQYGILLKSLRSLSGPQAPAALPVASAVPPAAAAPAQNVVLAMAATSGTLLLRASAIVVSDEWPVLNRSIDSLKADLKTNPLVPTSERQFAVTATLAQLLENVATRRWALQWLSTTPFSAYVYYGVVPTQTPGTLDVDRKFFVEPLFHRLSKRSQHVERAQSDLPGFDEWLSRAIRQVETTYGRKVAPAELRPHGLDRLVELANLLARAVAAHLERPTDAAASETFENLRTRIRYAENVMTGETHIRDRNPLP
jgi:hypothetical protein